MSKTFCLKMAAVALGIGLAGPAMAADNGPCAAGLVCASTPQTVVDALKAIAPDAKVGTSTDGTPKFSISAAYNYDITFTDCDEGGKKCAALVFESGFTKDPKVDLAFVNDFNVQSRIAKASLDGEGQVNVRYDFSTVGGVTSANLKDVKEWWDSQLGSYSEFYKQRSGKNGSTRK